MGLVDGKLVIIGLDPGGTTGWALYTANVIHNVDGQPEYYNEAYNAGQIGPGPHHLRLWHLLEQWTTVNTIIVCESFEFRRNDRDATRDNIVLVSKEYIGVVNLYAQTFEETTSGLPGEFKVVFQTAAMGKGFWDDRKLEVVGLLQTPKTTWPHANDAMRHILQYMVFKMNRQDLLQPLRSS